MKKLSLLPLSTHELTDGLTELASSGESLSPDEILLDLEGGFERWIQGGCIPSRFPANLSSLLNHAGWTKGSFDLGKQYPVIYQKLYQSSGVSSGLVLSLLSHLKLVQDLVCEYQFSSAKVCQVISALDERLQVDFKTMGVILRGLSILPELSIDSVSDVLDSDKKHAEIEYADADLSDLSRSLRDLGESLHLHNKFCEAAERLFNPKSNTPKIPYLQVLMCICAVVPFYDHPCEVLYEFSPRGALGDLVMDEFPKDLVHTKNAMLNNVKSVYRLTEDWARSKKGLPDQAFALVTIVEGLSSLSYSARKILAEAIRRVIFRSLEVLTPAGISIKEVRNKSEMDKILRSIQVQNTATAGILEQRVTDFFAVARLSNGKWRVRGLGDSVNASNTSSKKLGDLDFQNATNLSCEAFEAHGGKLNSAYFNDHILTFEQTLKHRILEWRQLGEIEQWSCHVTFVAHEFSEIECKERKIEGVDCRFTLLTFEEAVNEIFASPIGEGKLVEIFNRTVVSSLNRPGCAHAVRQRAVVEFGFRSSAIKTKN